MSELKKMSTWSAAAGEAGSEAELERSSSGSPKRKVRPGAGDAARSRGTAATTADTRRDFLLVFFSENLNWRLPSCAASTRVGVGKGWEETVGQLMDQKSTQPIHSFTFRQVAPIQPRRF